MSSFQATDKAKRRPLCSRRAWRCFRAQPGWVQSKPRAVCFFLGAGAHRGKLLTPVSLFGIPESGEPDEEACSRQKDKQPINMHQPQITKLRICCYTQAGTLLSSSLTRSSLTPRPTSWLILNSKEADARQLIQKEREPLNFAFPDS